MVTTGAPRVPPWLAKISMDQDEGPGEYQPIPLDKIEDFGVHCKQHLGWNLGYTQVMPLPSCDVVILEIHIIYMILDFYHQEQQKEKNNNTYQHLSQKIVGWI